MNDQTDQVLLIPRYTSMAGDVYTAPINVRSYSEAQISVWRSGGLDGIGASDVIVQESPDLEHWSDNGSTIGTVAGETTDSRGFRLDWMRLKVSGDPLTYWAVGNFVRRQG